MGTRTRGWAGRRSLLPPCPLAPLPPAPSRRGGARGRFQQQQKHRQRSLLPPPLSSTSLRTEVHVFKLGTLVEHELELRELIKSKARKKSERASGPAAAVPLSPNCHSSHQDGVLVTRGLVPGYCIVLHSRAGVGRERAARRCAAARVVLCLVLVLSPAGTCCPAVVGRRRTPSL